MEIQSLTILELMLLLKVDSYDKEEDRDGKEVYKDGMKDKKEVNEEFARFAKLAGLNK